MKTAARKVRLNQMFILFYISDISSLSLFCLFAHIKVVVVVQVKDMMNDPVVGTKVTKTVC